MSLFPRTFISNDPTNFHPLFRFLDDFDAYSRGTDDHLRRGGHIMRSFNPKFDVKEVDEAYELHGELPGVEQRNIDIEFTDSQTLVIRGRTERSYTAGTPPSGYVEESPEASGAITEGEPGKASSSSSSGHRATVEEEDDAGNVLTPKTASEREERATAPREKYWVSERSVGEFSRSFTFPVRVDSEQVKASLNNGILSIIVPKSKREQARKITIS